MADSEALDALGRAIAAEAANDLDGAYIGATETLSALYQLLGFVEERAPHCGAELRERYEGFEAMYPHLEVARHLHLHGRAYAIGKGKDARFTGSVAYFWPGPSRDEPEALVLVLMTHEDVEDDHVVIGVTSALQDALALATFAAEAIERTVRRRRRVRRR